MVLIQSYVQVPGNTDTLLDPAADSLRFVTEFFEAISQSASHIYHSALPLAPHSSVVRKLYGQHIHSPMSRIVTGIPTSWDSCTASAGAASEVGCAVWSPCGQSIAVGMGTVIEVRDSNTLERISTLEAPTTHLSAHSLSFSPDGRLLACLQEQENKLSPRSSVFRGNACVHVWDVQTGAIIRSIHVHGPGEIVFSGDSNRRVINFLPSFPSSKQYQFHIYDVLEDTQPHMAGLPWSHDH